jgi:hypothetical protein
VCTLLCTVDLGRTKLGTLRTCARVPRARARGRRARQKKSTSPPTILFNDIQSARFSIVRVPQIYCSTGTKLGSDSPRHTQCLESFISRRTPRPPAISQNLEYTCTSGPESTVPRTQKLKLYRLRRFDQLPRCLGLIH